MTHERIKCKTNKQQNQNQPEIAEPNIKINRSVARSDIGLTTAGYPADSLLIFFVYAIYSIYVYKWCVWHVLVLPIKPLCC